MRDRPGLRPTIRAARRPVDRRDAPRTAGPPPPGQARVGTPVYQVLGCLLLLDERMGVPGPFTGSGLLLRRGRVGVPATLSPGAVSHASSLMRRPSLPR